MKNAIILILFLVISPVFAANKKDLINKIEKHIVKLHSYPKPSFSLIAESYESTGFITKEGYIVSTFYASYDKVGITAIINTDEKLDTLALRVLYRDSLTDISILEPIGKKYYSEIEILPQENLKQAQDLMIIGYSNLSKYKNEITSSYGILSSPTNDTILEANAPINYGMYGSPVIDLNGNYIGLVNKKSTSSKYEKSAYFVGSKYILEALEKIKDSTVSKKESMFGTADSSAYVKINKAGLIRKDIKELEDYEYYIDSLDNAINLCKQAISNDKGYLNARLILADLYLKNSISHCRERNSVQAENSIGDFNKQFKIITKEIDVKDSNELEYYKYIVHKARTILIYTYEYNDNYNEEIDDEIFTLNTEFKDVNCKMWNHFLNSYENGISGSEERSEEISDYFNYGVTPEKLYKNINLKQNIKQGNYRTLTPIGLWANMDIGTLEGDIDKYSILAQNFEMSFDTYFPGDLPLSNIYFGVSNFIRNIKTKSNEDEFKTKNEYFLGLKIYSFLKVTFNVTQIAERLDFDEDDEFGNKNLKFNFNPLYTSEIIINDPNKLRGFTDYFFSIGFKQYAEIGEEEKDISYYDPSHYFLSYAYHLGSGLYIKSSINITGLDEFKNFSLSIGKYIR